MINKEIKLIEVLLFISKKRNRIQAARNFVAHNRISKSKESKIVHLLDFWIENNRFKKANTISLEMLTSQDFIEHQEDLKSKNSQLVKALEDFLIYDYIKNKTTLREKLISEIYQNTELHDLSLSVLRGQTKKLKQKEEFDFEANSLIWSYHHNYYFKTNSSKHNDDQARLSFEMAHRNLDQIYWVLKSKYAIEALIRHEEYGDAIDENLIQDVLDRFPNEISTANFLLRFYYQMLQLLITPNEKAFMALAEAFKTYPDIKKVVPVIDIFNALLSMVRFCFPARNPETTVIYKDLYEFALDNDLLWEDGKISPDHFNNIIDIYNASRLFDKAEAFNNQYFSKVQLKEEEKENAENLVKAFQLFNEGKFAKAKKILEQLKFTDVSYALRKHTLMVRTYFEFVTQQLNEYTIGYNNEQVISACDSLNKYVNKQAENHKISPGVKLAHNNFVKLVKRMMRLETKNHTKTVLLIELYENDIVCPAWLETKIKAMNIPWGDKKLLKKYEGI